jgi:acetyltransferase-like isoleucine patch superfamily enzyme
MNHRRTIGGTFSTAALPVRKAGRVLRAVVEHALWRLWVHADPRVQIDRTVRVRHPENVHVGADSRIEAGCLLLAGRASNVVLGRAVRLAPGVVLDAEWPAPDPDPTDQPLGAVTAPRTYGHVVLGDEVTVHAGAVVLAGVRIADGVTIAPGTVVSQDVTEPGAFLSPDSPARPGAAEPAPPLRKAS